MSGVSRRRGKRTSTPWSRKRRRVLVWVGLPLLLLLPWTIWRAGVAGDVRTQLAVLEAAGQPVTLAQLNGLHATPTGSINAAPLYLEALALYRDVPPAQWSFLPFLGMATPEPGTALSPETREATAALIAANEETLQKLDAAKEADFCRYIDPYRPAGYNDLGPVRQLETLAKLACAAAVYYADRGESAAAGAALDSALALTHSMGSVGLFTILASQWEIEGHVLEALQFTMSHSILPDSTLDGFSAHFTPARRREQIAHMVTIERCLFLARVREGYRRGMGRNLLVATGVGDLNSRAYLGLIGHIVAWIDAPPVEQRDIEARFDAEWNAVTDTAFLFLTLHVSRPPGYWDNYRKTLDEATLVRVGLALYRFRATHGYFPDNLNALAPAIDPSDLILQTTGEPMRYEKRGNRVELNNGGLATRRRGIKSGSPNTATPIDPHSLERIEFLIAYPREEK